MLQSNQAGPRRGAEPEQNPVHDPVRDPVHAMDAPQYPGYPPHYWYPQAHSSGHYTSTDPSGSEVQPQFSSQVLPSAYPNSHDVYGPSQSQYPTRSFHPSNPFYCSDPQRLALGPYPSQGCPVVPPGGPSGQPHYPGAHCQGGAGFPAGPYPHYSESGHIMPPTPPYPTGQPLHPSPQADAWARPGAFASAQHQWQPGQQPPLNHYGNPVRAAPPPAWPGSGTGAPPPYQAKDQQGPEPRPAPSQNGKPAGVSSPPQLYKKTRQGEPNPSEGEPPPSAPGAPPTGQTGAPPLMVQQVMARVLLLQEDVDEFVGRKTDKSYRCLEELLTKELLLLDSVETRGQEDIRQARKEAVQRIQAILDRLEKKAF
ncbi:BAG family molecular chaperone regulator 4 [Brachionichthys hirsutus]|uniref:BAG family molecular chaperone regulator 4 n=1 Tax=Brachionichthys hirsutus TaxID=412623 RepID=UPI00360432F6